MNKNFIKHVKDANDIVAVINSITSISLLEIQEGRENLLGYCLFCQNHDSGKFEVNQRKQIFKCWTCGAFGDVIKFVELFNGCSFKDAVEYLAKRAGIEIKKKADRPMSEINPRNLWYGIFVPDWLLQRTEVSQGAKLCYARLCRYHNPNNDQCNPKHETIAKELGIKKRMVAIYINELIEQKLIRRFREPGPGKSNNYVFLNHKWFASALKKKKPESRKDAAKSDINSPF